MSSDSDVKEELKYEISGEQSYNEDEKQLSELELDHTSLSLGYRQTLHRTYQFFDNFSIGFIALYFVGGIRIVYTTGIFAGGPQAYWISYLISCIGMSITAAVMAESCSALPVSGSIYLWASKYASPKYKRLIGFLVAWWSISAWVSFVAGNTQSAVNFLLSELPIFGVNFPTSTNVFKFRIVQWLLSEFLLAFSTVINYLKPDLFKYALRISCMIIILDFFLNIIWLPIGVSKTYGFQDITFLMETYNGTNATPIWNWCLSFLSTSGVLIGFDAPGHLAEETKNASLATARSIFTSVLVTGLFGIPVVFLFIFCSPKLDVLFSLDVPQPFVQLYSLALGKKAHVFLNLVIIFGHLLNTTVAITSSSRLVYAAARDGAFFMHNWLSKVDPWLQPRNSVTLVWIISSIILCTILVNQVAFTSLISAMALPTVCAYGLIAFLRLLHKSDDSLQVKWSLGRFSRPFQFIAFIWCIFVISVLASPYQFPISLSTFNYAPIMLVLVTIGSLIVYWIYPHNTWLI
ncbi:hypothetical protein T552_04167 [Pneumocystis carinii B80]|uniref:Amino acid permease/ SLC12A domain-containing protein n=1 Tax=Pneumocystis carinii (strain B80) TaxID=1408658 RepID=A0A0W4ZFA1_PNEC8|nr:hypothetical protein T552_04167 [Pneumocystis carinii B80]KTW27073.1 hypothetical protein T552_04167 [Pneumocystis carinii B80]